MLYILFYSLYATCCPTNSQQVELVWSLSHSYLDSAGLAHVDEACQPGAVYRGSAG